MYIPSPLLSGVLVRRYKRFIADIKLANGRVVSAHCPNSGSMLTCAEPGWKVRISKAANPLRKLKYTWEMVHNGKCWIGINTIRTNKIAMEAIVKGKIAKLAGYPFIRPEVAYGTRSRIDLQLEKPGQKCYVEVKSVTLVQADGLYRFPDAVTERGAKHLDELVKVKKQGHRAVMLFIVQRRDGTRFSPADHIDPTYGKKLRNANKRGVELLAYGTRITATTITVTGKIPILL